MRRTVSLPYLEYNNMGCLTRWYTQLEKTLIENNDKSCDFLLPDFGTNTYQPLYKTSLTNPFLCYKNEPNPDMTGQKNSLQGGAP